MGTNAPNESWQIPPSALLREDTLLNCLVILTKLWNKPFSPEALIAGLPLQDGCLTPELFLRAAWRGGLSAKIAHRPLDDIPDLVLPAVLLLKDYKACILIERNKDGSLQIIHPDTGVGVIEMPRHKLASLYEGHAIYAKPAFRFEDRVSKQVLAGKTDHWFLDVLLKSWPIYSDVIVSSLLLNIFTLATYFYAINVFDRVVPNNGFETLWVLTIGIIIIIIFEMILKILRSYFTDLAGKKAELALSATIFERVLGLQLSAKPASVGSFMGSMNEFNALRELMTSTTLLTFVDLPFIFLFIAVIWWVGGALAFIPLALVPIGLLIGYLLQPHLSDLVRESVKTSTQKQATLAETLACLEPIKAFGAEGQMQSKWENQVGAMASSSLKAHIFSSITSNLTWMLQQFATVAVVVYGVYLVTSHEITMGALIVSWVLTRRVLSPLGQITNMLARYNQARDALKFFDRMMAMPLERPAGHQFVSQPGRMGKIEFRDVTFTYPGSLNAALSNVSFTINKGERVGILGRIGSGKTTVEKLILGLYRPTSGTILIDDIDITQMDPVDLRRQIGYVPQDVVLFYGSVRANIMIAAPHSRDSDMLRAAEIACVADFIRLNPRGYDLIIGERGESLSGGQKQAIAIARALLQRPSMLLFDEPSNSMDQQTERTFLQRLLENLHDETLLVVTHHHSILPLVNRLIILDAGKVVADGPKEKILAELMEGKINATKNG